jgi:RHS repeat-associated protein
VKFTYDPDGRMIRREDQKGDTVTFNHTMAGTITSRNYRTKANSPSGTIADSDTFTFDNLGRMLTAVSGRYSNTVTMNYDNYGRLKDESLTIAARTYTVTRAYDNRSRLTQLTYPNGSIVQRTYTTRSQLHTVRYLGTIVDTRTYDDGGRLNTSTYANGAVVSFAYRNDNLPTSIATTHAGSPNIGTYSYTWDANKNKTGETITSTMSGFGFSTGATGYDDEDRLQTWNRTNGTMNQAWTLSAVGNWNNFTSAGSTWNRTHSNAHEFTGFTGASTGTLAYDVKGNQTSRPSTLSAPALNLDWNFDNQLRGADTNGSAGSLEVTFEYDALGRRVSRSHSSGNVVYVHAGQQVIADYARGAVTSSPTYRYVYADYVDEPIVRHTGTATTLPTTGDNALYYHRNQQYSIIGLTNAAGTLVERYSYSAYGTLGIYAANGTVRTSSTYANRYTYTGREYDPDLNLYHFRARWYDPATGGFISRDPLGYVDGMSRYRAYFGMSKVDPAGFCKMWPRQDVISEIDFLTEAINNLPPFQPELSHPKVDDLPGFQDLIPNEPKIPGGPSFDSNVTCEDAVARFLSAMAADPIVKRALDCNVRIFCHENCMANGMDNDFGGFAYSDAEGPIVCLNSSTLKSWGGYNIGGLLLHELVHVVDLVDHHGCKCPDHKVEVPPTLMDPGTGWGNCNKCKERETKAYSRQALFYGLTPGSPDYEQFVEAGVCTSCKHAPRCRKKCPDYPSFAIVPEVLYYAPNW